MNKLIQLYLENLNNKNSISSNKEESDIFLNKYKHEVSKIIINSSSNDKYIYEINNVYFGNKVDN